MANIYELARRVKHGVRLLDQKIPNWRVVLRKHEDQFDFSNGDCCVLGTLEHYSGRMKVLKARNRKDKYDYDDYGTFKRAYKALGIDEPSQYGFDWIPNDQEAEAPVLADLWRAEFSK